MFAKGHELRTMQARSACVQVIFITSCGGTRAQHIKDMLHSELGVDPVHVYVVQV